MIDSALTNAERRFVEELDARGVRFMIVGLTAAVLQGANTLTRDIDLWFEQASDPRIPEAANAAGGFWVSGFGMMPPQLGGSLGDRLDVVFRIDGLQTFDVEYARSRTVEIDGVPIHVLPLDRVLASKRAANRLKDQAVIPALEEALAALDDSK